MTGTARRLRGKAVKLRAGALGVLCLAWLTVAAPVHADQPRVENRCQRLSSLEYDELDARVQLLLRGAKSAGPAPAIHCDAERAWVTWQGARLDLEGSDSLVDEAIDVIDARLHQAAPPLPAGRSPAAPPVADPTGEAAPSAEGAGSPPAALRVERRRRRGGAEGGGLTVGIETEHPSEDIGVVVGPAFDFAGSVGPLLLGGREAFRFGAAKHRLVLMDFEGMVAYGAPLVPERLFGASLRFGAEWLVAYTEGNSGQASVAPIVSLGLRAAKTVGPVQAWAGIDARVRLVSLAIRSRDELSSSRLSGSFTLGVAFVNWTLK